MAAGWRALATSTPTRPCSAPAFTPARQPATWAWRALRSWSRQSKPRCGWPSAPAAAACATLSEPRASRGASSNAIGFMAAPASLAGAAAPRCVSCAWDNAQPSTARTAKPERRRRTSGRAGSVPGWLGGFLAIDPQELLVQLFLGFGVVGVNHDAVHRAHFDALRGFIVPDALGAQARVDDIDFIPL